jgi:hypothetical protein
MFVNDARAASFTLDPLAPAPETSPALLQR